MRWIKARVTSAAWWGWLVSVWGARLSAVVLAGTAAYASAFGDAKIPLLVVSTVAAGVVPDMVRAGGVWIGQPSRRDAALGNALVTLVSRLLEQTASADPHVPAVRATAFIKQERNGGEVMVPHLRVTSSNPTKVCRWNRDFESGAVFNRGDLFVGQVWVDPKKELCEDVKALIDFGEISGDDNRLKAWAAQFAGAGRSWSPYMRSVRSIWVFGILDTDGKTLIALVSVDSPKRGAFGRSTSADESSQASADPTLFAVSVREAIATTVVGYVLARLGD
jgi:hypothetical protein